MVHKVVAVPMLVYQRVVFTYGPLLAVIFLVGLGGVLSVTAAGVAAAARARWPRPGRCARSALHWAPRGTTMLPWVTAVALLVTPIALADFDYRYLLPAIPFACLAAGLAFAPRRTAPAGPAARPPRRTSRPPSPTRWPRSLPRAHGPDATGEACLTVRMTGEVSTRSTPGSGPTLTVRNSYSDSASRQTAQAARLAGPVVATA